MTWTVRIKKRTVKQIKKCPKHISMRLAALLAEIEVAGPVRGNWPNYGKIAPNRHHCHLKKGRPTYVAIWEEMDQEIRLVEVIYVGTHEKAPY